MCGRYAIECEEENIFLKEILEEINRRYAENPILDRMKTGEIFPTETVPILALEKEKATPVLMNWGFPRPGASGVVINARAETVMEKHMFRSSVLSRRCVVPSTGFYEWQQVPGQKKKDKYLLRTPSGPMLYMAGLYNLFPGGQGGRTPGFVIVTIAANEWVSPIHNRMPLILNTEESEAWLRDVTFASKALLEPCHAPLLLMQAN